MLRWISISLVVGILASPSFCSFVGLARRRRGLPMRMVYYADDACAARALRHSVQRDGPAGPIFGPGLRPDLFSPAFVLSMMSDRSNSATAPRIVKTILPYGVLVSMLSVREMVGPRRRGL